MPILLNYGQNESVSLEPAPGALVAQCGMPRQVVLSDPEEALRAALAAPLDYPPLAASALASDRVCVALDHGVPQGPRIVAGVIRCLVEANVDPDGITVLRTEPDAVAGNGDPRPWLDNGVAGRITLAAHRPDAREELAYLAASHAGEPILLNRAITDADVVVPVGALAKRQTALYHGIHGPVFPTFSDAATLARFRSPRLLETPALHHKLVKLCNEVGWLLGVTFTVQAVPGPGDALLHLLAGEVSAVRRRGRELYEAAWTCSVPRRASLVVATLHGGPEQQTWQNLGEALAAAEALVEDGGAIALCCGLSDPPGQAVQWLAESRSRSRALRHIRKERPADALAATRLAHTLGRVSVYLLSGLEATVVEDLQMVPLAVGEEVARLVRRHPSCILLSNAAHAMARLQ